MTPKRYFSLRSTLGPPPSNLPAVILGILALLTVAGLFVEIGNYGV